MEADLLIPLILLAALLLVSIAWIDKDDPDV